MPKTPREQSGSLPEVRKGQPSVQLSQDEFRKRMRERFYDPAFDSVREEIERAIDVAWNGYEKYRKSPRHQRAGEGFANPEAMLPTEWLQAREAIAQASERQRNPASPSRILLVCGAARSDQTCPGEMSKTYRLLMMAQDEVEKESGFEADVLDLSHLTSEYGRVIYPCKACVSTAMPLCHWPCSCYPNHAMGQVNDWMNEIYPRWAAAHGVFIVTPVYWYQAPSALKLMIDRLVCADGGNPDPTSTDGKNPAKAKALELAGWSYPRHLAGRAFSVVVHGDADGVENVRRALTDWLNDLKLIPAEPNGGLGRYIGYYEPYAKSHQALDKDEALAQEVKSSARALVQRVRQIRSGSYHRADEGQEDPRPK